jgi:thiol:disulfide interchange protein
VILVFYCLNIVILRIKTIKKKVNSLWQKFEPKKIDSLVKSGKIVFVDIAADWCITCKYSRPLSKLMI